MNYQNFKNLYVDLLKRVYFDFDDIIAPRGLSIKECQNVQFTLTKPLCNLFQSDVRPYPIKYLAGELWWYLTGRNDVKFIQNYSKFWNKIANKDGTANSAYGHLLFKEAPNEWAWAYNSLTQDRDTRQAIMHFNKPKHMIYGIKDFPCTLTGTFQIRRNKLNFTIVMRSQDMIKGLTFDLPCFSVLQQCMLQLQRQQYRNLELGNLTLFVQSLHIYKNDFPLVCKMMLNPFTDNQLPPVNYTLLSSNGNFKQIEVDPLYSWINQQLNGGM